MPAQQILLRRSGRARRLSLRVDMARRRIVFTVPENVAGDDLERFLERHRLWIERTWARLPEPVRLAPGSAIPYRGAPRLVRHDPSWPRQPRATDAFIHVGGPAAHVARRLLRWLRAEAEVDLARAVAAFAARLEVTIGRMSIRDTTSRWGSCTAAGNLSFSWRLILAPPEVLRYVAAHEVAHRREMNHSPRFWALVASLVGDVRAPRAWLHDNGAGLYAVVPPSHEGGG